MKLTLNYTDVVLCEMQRPVSCLFLSLEGMHPRAWRLSLKKLLLHVPWLAILPALIELRKRLHGQNFLNSEMHDYVFMRFAYIWLSSGEKGPYDKCEKERLSLACASAQSESYPDI